MRIGILKRKVVFGEDGNSDEEDSEEEDYLEYRATFTTDQLYRITKLAGLSSTMQIFPASSNLPLLFKTNIGSLGKIANIYKIKRIIGSRTFCL